MIYAYAHARVHVCMHKIIKKKAVLLPFEAKRVLRFELVNFFLESSKEEKTLLLLPMDRAGIGPCWAGPYP